MTSNDTCFYIAAPALCARDRPCLSDKHPISANPECKAWQVDVADALACAAPKGGVALVVEELAQGIERQQLSASAPNFSCWRCLLVSRHSRLTVQSRNQAFRSVLFLAFRQGARSWGLLVGNFGCLTCHQGGSLHKAVGGSPVPRDAPELHFDAVN